MCAMLSWCAIVAKADAVVHFAAETHNDRSMQTPRRL